MFQSDEIEGLDQISSICPLAQDGLNKVRLGILQNQSSYSVLGRPGNGNCINAASKLRASCPVSQRKPSKPSKPYGFHSSEPRGMKAFSDVSGAPCLGPAARRELIEEQGVGHHPEGPDIGLLGVAGL